MVATISTSTALARVRNGMASPIARAAVRPPSQHTRTRSSFSAGLVDIRHDDDRPAGLKQRRLDDQIFARELVGFGLTDDRDIEPARHPSE